MYKNRAILENSTIPDYENRHIRELTELKKMYIPTTYPHREGA
jgi:hypothetical protein